MEGLTAKVYNGVKCYWRTRRYHRLETTTVDGGHEEEEQQQRRRRRIRLNIPRLKLKLPRSPKKLFIKLRDGYVTIMMKLANTSVIRGRTMSGGYDGDGFGKTTKVFKEYDEKVIIEICKNLAIRRNHHLHHHQQQQQQQQISSQIACSSG